MACPRLPVRTLLLLSAAIWLPALATLLRPALIAADEAIAPSDPEAATDGILVMRTGTVLAGKILLSGDLYEVRSSHGTMSVPTSLVKLRCANLREAYGRLRETALSHRSANAHITLAKWCLTNQLLKESRQELDDALLLEPDREEAKRLLRNVEETLSSSRKIPGPARDPDPVRTARQSGTAGDDAEALGGLTHGQALQFTRRIQPLLVKTCATAGCHSLESETSFKLHHVTPGKNANRHATEVNLAEILEQIDVERPRASRLLVIPRGKHGKHGRPVFNGPRGDDQFTELQRWVVEVANDEADRNGKSDVTPQRSRSIRQVSLEDQRSAAESRARSGASSGHGLPVTTTFPPIKPISKDAHRDLPARTEDPFDPAVFNRGNDRRAGR